MFKKSSTGLAKMSSLFVILVLLTSIFTIYTPLTSSTVVPTADMWTTDIDGTPKLDFRPEETVYIHGAGFPAESFFDIVVIRPDGTIVDGSAGFDPVCNEEGPLLDGCYDTVLSDYDGSFIYQYILNGIYGTYHVNAFDDQGIVVSSMTFTDHTWSDVDINGGDVTTGFLDVTLSIAWSGEGGDPTQMRFVNVEPGTACTTLPITVWPAWEPIATEKPWTLLPGDAGYRKVCMQTAHGILGTPDRLKQADDSILYFIVEPNPELEQSCGLDMVLVIDSSGSINSSELGQMKDAYEDFVTAFLPATPTLIGVVDFDTTASVIQTFTDDVPTLITAVNTPTSGGYTNWQDALVKAHGMFDPRDNHPDLIVFASDGNPNRQGNPAVTVTEQEAVQAAVVEANSIKSDGIRIIALGIGTDLDADNLRAISSHDALITSDFGDLAQDLADLALELCGGTITVRKLVDGVGVPDWEYMADVVGGTPSPLSGYTDQDGYITFDIDISDTTADVDVIETLQGGYSLDSASCVRRDQTSIGTFDGFDSVDGITIGLNNIISCEFNNIVEASCGDGEINQQSEQCDDNGANTDTPCTPGYESSCTYCDTSCQEHTVDGPYCGDGIMNGPEECDGTDGVGPHEACSQTCELEDLTYCGDGIMQFPNEEGIGGPLNDGYEDCDGTDGVGPFQTCTVECELVDYTYCGDGIWQNPNTWGNGGPSGKGDEECDGTDNVGPHETCESDCTITYLTYCGDGITQLPNEEGTGGPYNDGYEDCDGTDNVGPHEVCESDCTVTDLTYCGDGIAQTPNDELLGGPVNDGFEECDDGNGVPGDGCYDCTLEIPDDCLEADYVFEFEKLLVCGDDCSQTCPTLDMTSIDVPVGARYDVEGRVYRGAPGQCQPHEDFYLEVNGEFGPDTVDDPGACAISVRMDELGDFYFNTGLNDVEMHTAAMCPPDQTAESVRLDKLCLYYVEECGNGIVDAGEQCDENGANTDTPCDPAYDSSCTYCDTTCNEHTLEGPYCGDGIMNGPEECDGTDGVGPYQSCSQTCELVDYTYCGDGVWQNPNTWGDGGPSGKGDEECDGTDNVGPHEVCEEDCTLTHFTYCGDGIMQTPNDEFLGGPFNDGYEDCDGTDGVGPYEVCTDNCVLLSDDLCPLVEVITPEDNDPILWYKDGILVKASVSDPFPSSGIKEVRVGFHDITHTWDDGMFIMAYKGASGFFEYQWDSTKPGLPACGIVQADVFGEDYEGNGARNECGDTNTFGIDNAPPITEKTIGDPKHGDGYYVTTDTLFTLTATDCGTGVDYIHYEIWWDSDDDTFVDTQVREETVHSNQTSFTFEEESIHEIRWYAADLIGNVEQMHYQEHAVDDSEPETTKTVGDPKVECTGGECDYYITQQTEITFECTDPEPHPANDVTVYYRYSINGGDWTEPMVYDGPFTFPEDSEHTIEYWCVDALGNEEEHQFEVDIVDTEPPEIEKVVGEPKHACEPQEECDYYVTQDTPITVTATDPQPHPVNDVELWCEWEWTNDDANGYHEPFLVDGPFTFTEDSEHYLHCWAIDALGNRADFYEFDIVDTEEPEIDKSVGQPNHLCEEGEDCHYYITQDTEITLECVDADPHPVDHTTLYWRLYLDGETPPEFTVEEDSEVRIQNTEDSRHILEYYCEDILGNTNDDDGDPWMEIDIVESQPPEIEKVVGEPKVACEPEDECDYYVTQDTTITVTAVDPDPHPVNHVELWCEWEWTDGQSGGIVGPFLVDGPFTFTEDSEHYLHCWAVDALGNEAHLYEIDIVDSQEPETTKTVGEPKVACEQGEECDYYITQQTEITFECTDPQPHPVDDTTIYYKYKINDGEWLGPFVYEEAFTFTEDSRHTLEFWCEDALGNEEEHQFEVDVVDTQIPVINKTMGEPNHLCEEEVEDCHYYITQDTVITLDCYDEDPHPVDHVTLYWRDYLDGDTPPEFTVETDGYVEIQKEEDSRHILEYYCEDALGNMNDDEGYPWMEIDIVDTQPPEIEKVIGDPHFGCEVEEDCYVTQDTTITVTATDPQPHPVNHVELWCEWEWTNDDTNGYQEPFLVEEAFTYTEDSEHYLHCWAIDALGNEAHFYETDIVESVPPVSHSNIYDGPSYPEDCAGESECWITQNTRIQLICSDPDPHPVRETTKYYRFYRDGELIEDWTEYTGPIQFDHDSHHTLEYYCVDGLGNTEETHVEPYDVDTEGPLMDKWIVDPTVQSGETVEICANITDIKQTQDPGVGLYEAWVTLTLGDDPIEIVLEHVEGDTYCGEWVAEDVPLCVWNVWIDGVDLLGNTNGHNGIEIVIDDAEPKLLYVLKPHAGQDYRDGKPFSVYAPAIDFGGDDDVWNEDMCKASSVDYCSFVAIDYDFEGVNQSEIKNLWDYLDWLEELEGNPILTVDLGTVPYENGVCKGVLEVPEDSGLTDVVFLGYEVVDKSGNSQSGLAFDSSGDKITMNMDNSGPGVIITDLGNLPGPFSSGQNVMVQAEVQEYDSGFDQCWADLYQYGDEQELIFTGIRLQGFSLDHNLCEINDFLPFGLQSGNYQLQVNARDETFNIGSDWADLIIDNTPPEGILVSPTEEGSYSTEIPVEMVAMDLAGVDPVTVQYRIFKLPAWFGECLFVACYDSGWLETTLTDGDQFNGTYTDTFNVTEAGLNNGEQYLFRGRACDTLYDPTLVTEDSIDPYHCTYI